MNDALTTYVRTLLETDRKSYQGVEFNSRNVKPGMIFLALKGEKSHGAQFAVDAVNRGARAVVVDQEGKKLLPTNLETDVIVVNDVIKSIHECAAFYREKFKGVVIGITGSAGKTTVKEMIITVLSAKYQVAYSYGNFNNHIGLPYSILNSPLNADFYVFEIGTNHPGEIATLASIMKPDWSLITNIGTAHIGFFGTQEAIANEKMDIFKLTDKNGMVFINKMDPFLKNAQVHCKKVTLALNDKQADITLFLEEITSNGKAILKSDKGITFELPVPGKHQAVNALFAYAIGIKAGLNDQEIISALQKMQSVGKRMEIVKMTPFMVVNDAYNANKESVFAAIEYLENLDVNKKILVLGDIFELGENSRQIHLEIGKRIVKSSIDFALLIGNETRAIAEELNSKKIMHFDSQNELVEKLNQLVEKKDAVLFKASRGMALEKIIEQWIGTEHVS